jgi:hypothetical protein
VLPVPDRLPEDLPPELLELLELLELPALLERAVRLLLPVLPDRWLLPPDRWLLPPERWLPDAVRLVAGARRVRVLLPLPPPSPVFCPPPLAPPCLP